MTKIYLRVLIRVCKLEIQLGNTKSVPKQKEKLRVFIQFL